MVIMKFTVWFAKIHRKANKANNQRDLGIV